MKTYRFTVHDSRNGSTIGTLDLELESDQDAVAEAEALVAFVGVMADEVRRETTTRPDGFRTVEELREVATV